MSLSVSFHTFGCKLNQVETEEIAARFAAAGFTICEGLEADLFFVNTCAVTHRAEAKSRRLIRKLADGNPGRVIAAGCLAQMKPNEIAALGDLKLILGTSERFGVVEYLDKAGENRIYTSKPNGAQVFPCAGNRFRSRIFIKIQDGCDHRCSYCIVPKLRGGSISISSRQVIESVKSALKDESNEIVLTGVDIGSYDDGEGADLAELLKKLVDLPEVVRIRLSSIEPPGFTAELIDACADSDKICPHFHIPLQSGSDRILKLMGRDYSADEYTDLVNALADKSPHARIGADVIVGFPHETREDFEKTVELVENSPLNHIHVFPFSPRPGTNFSSQEDDIPPVTKAQRGKILREIISAKNEIFVSKNLGRIENVYFEGGGAKGGLTSNYIRVFTPNKNYTGFAMVRLVKMVDHKVMGEIIE